MADDEAHRERVFRDLERLWHPQAEALEKMTSEHGRCVLANERLRAEKAELRAALEKYESAFESLFVQCVSTNRPPRDLTLLNEAHRAARAALGGEDG